MRWLICTLLACHALPVWAWSGQGHGALTEAALALLSVPEQKYFTDRAQRLINNDAAKKWQRSYKGLSPFALAAIWPDTRRDQTLQTLFSRYAKTEVPVALKPYAGFHTNRWHYVNAQFWDLQTQQLHWAGAKGARCKTREYGDLVKMWPPLLDAYSQVDSPAAEGLILAFIAHLLEDAYQPLHAMASLNAQCETDAGGNKYCLDDGAQHRCKLNLHRLWDRGFGVFNFPLTPLSTKSEATTTVQNAVVLAAKVGGKQAGFIYSTAPNKMPPSNYQADAAAQVKSQSAKAIVSLAQVLHTLYEVKHGRQ